MSLVRFQGLSRVYGSGDSQVRALDRVNLEVEPGEFVSLMGPSGSGKSTALNVMGCLDRSTGGSYRFKGIEVTELDERARARLRRAWIGFVFQGFHLLPRSTAVENVELPLVYRGIGGAERRRKALAMLDEVGLADRADHLPGALSGGQQQRVAIARALAADPAVLLADEPTGNLDSARSFEILELLRRLNRERGQTIVMVTHEPEMAERTDRIVHFRDGRIEADHPVREDRMIPMLLDGLRLALRQLRSNWTRTALTSLGIAVGVAALIAIVGIGQGASRSISADLASMGSNLVMVESGTGGGPRAHVSAPPFKDTDAARLRSQVPHLAAVAPVAQASTTAVSGGQQWATSVTGSNGDWLEAGGWTVASGRSFTEGEERAGSSVCLIGETVRTNLFGDLDPLGASVRLGSKAECTVIGVLGAKGANTMGMDQDDLMLAPIGLVQRRLTGATGYDRILISVDDAANIDPVIAGLDAELRQLRHVTGDDTVDFEIRDTRQMASRIGGITTIVTGLLAAVAAVSLVVGGIGIMNVMLVSVTERTHEIGIRMAVGALEGDVMAQFLIEAGALAALGGVVGVGVGIGATGLGSMGLGIPFVVVPWAVVGAVVCSAGMGIAFGWMPARRAARLAPIDALRAP